jgi:uncharacterized damage-inducible protein DinB
MNAKELSGHWTQVRMGLFQALDKLNDAQLDFVPREGLWSLGTVARHIANAEEGWFRYAVTRELDEWPAEYSAADYPGVESVKALLSEVHARTEAYLATVDVTDLDRMLEMPWGEELSLRQVIWHVLEHELHHRGEIYLMLGLMGVEAPDV